MVNRLCFRNLRIDNFKLITWLQIFIIAITPNFIFLQSANATTVAGEGWSVTKRLVQGATTFYDGAKNVVLNGKNYAATGTAAITPVASQVGKMIARTGAVLAVDLAIKALIGAVDYVMDPANNQVIYYDRNNPTNCLFYSYIVSAGPSYKACGLEAAANLAKPYLESTDEIYKSYSLVSCSRRDSSDITNASYYSGTCTFRRIHKKTGESSTTWFSVNPLTNPAYSPENNKKTLSYHAVGSQIISDAVSEKSDAKAYVSSVADTALEDEQTQIIPADQVIDQLNQTQAIPTSNTATGSATPSTGTGTGTGTGDPTTQPGPTDITLHFPIFCSWAPTVCQAAQVVINFPGTVANYWKELKEWMNESASDTSETKPEIKELELNFDDGSRINFDQTCPQPQPIQVTFMGVTQDASFSFEPLCNFMIMIRPFVIGSAYLIGAYIVMGLSRGNSE
ncbi:virulence factor TspB C-terminal domain-related protein [Acinetobacter baumannii]|uniref:virulence factor TspB C-terminal domain-related protein n=1 Tax=Acinetobacter baumannii TaxID=470 RepID=UPI00280CA0ED|nr:virulence factor TspB C-terminal domain-related protein [Acinetobacter baumannii]MDQ9000878.1 virulence factor TspB C-terminal domain-related protein [Acinetobacter baumannii]MDQ9004353.1 virulence factor TspB C-terminal domain-related protein [Acinetobacter baumannii]